MAGSLGKMLIGKISLGVVNISKGSIGNIVIYSAGNTVTYHVDTDVIHQEDVDADDTVLSPKTFMPQKDGWEFWGWKQDTAANGDVLNSLTMGDDPITLYAVFRKAVTVTYYNPNVNTASDYIYYNNGTVVNPKFTISPNSYSGWTFRGWSATDAPNGQVIYQSVSSTEITSNVTLYQSFQKAVTLTVYNGSTTATTYNETAYSNGGITSDIYPTFTVTPAVVTGFSFRGWSTSNVGSAGITYNSLSNTQLTENIILYALYQQTITLSYNANSGSGNVAAQSGIRYFNSIGTYINPSFILSANSFIRSGYLFSKWAMGSVNGTQYTAGTTVTLSTSTVFYAVWVSSTLTVFAKSGIQTAPSVYNTSYVTLSGSFAGRTDVPEIVGSCYGYVWYVSGTSSASGSVTVKVPAPYTKATITMINHIDNMSANGTNLSYGSAYISGSFGSASRSIVDWTNNIGNFTGTATGTSLTLSASASVTKTIAESWAEFGWYISSIVLS